MDKQDKVAERLFDVVDDFRNAFLITRRPGGAMHARPLAVAKVEEGASAYFATSLDSPKIAEIEADPQVLLTFQAGAKFAALNGSAEIIRDKAVIDELWSDSWRVWFPEGRDDPSLCVLRIDVESGEYWDASGLKGIKVAIECANAVAHHRTPRSDIRDHGKV